MSTLEGILESLEKLKTKYVIEYDYEKATRVRELIIKIKEKIMEEKKLTFLERLQEEEKELSQKVAKLDDFIENNPAYEFVGDVQWVLLDAQRNAMTSYLHILQHRIGDLITNKD